MKKFIYFFIIISFVIFSCNNNETASTENKDTENVENTDQSTGDEIKPTRPAESKGKFLVKSAIIEFDTEMMNMKQNMVMYIENWGELNRVDMKGDIMGMKTHNINIIKDGFLYNIDMIQKKGVKTPYTKENKPDDIDFTALSEDVMKEFNMKKEGTEMFLGKKCDKYSINHTTTKMKGTYLVWMGIPLKTDISIAGIGMKMSAKNIDLDAVITPDIFNVPEGISITEGTAMK